MPAENQPVPPGIPAWFTTFSDVITLLMTFFILLLTFATSEPEKFEQMQIALFSGGGAKGIAGEGKSSLENDALLFRERSKAGRISIRGSEMPPIHKDPSYQALSKGLKGLEESEKRDLAKRHAMSVPVPWLVDEDNHLTSLALQNLRLLSKQMRSNAVELKLLVDQREDIPAAMALSKYLFESEGVIPGRIAVGQNNSFKKNNRELTLLLTRPVSGI